MANERRLISSGSTFEAEIGYSRAVVVVMIGLISPPVGMNMFVLKTLLPEVPTSTVFRGVMPFMWADVVRLAILVAFPAISLLLPGMMR